MHELSQTQPKQVVSLKNVTKRFGNKTIIDDFNLAIGHGEFLTILGPSGCGKTTADATSFFT